MNTHTHTCRAASGIEHDGSLTEEPVIAADVYFERQPIVGCPVVCGEREAYWRQIRRRAQVKDPKAPDLDDSPDAINGDVAPFQSEV